MKRIAILITLLPVIFSVGNAGEFINTTANAEFIISHRIYAYFVCAFSSEDGSYVNSYVVIADIKAIDDTSVLKASTAQVFARELKAAIESKAKKAEISDGEWIMTYTYDPHNRRSMNLEKRSLFKTSNFHFDYDDIVTFIDYCHDAETTAKTWLYDLMDKR